MKSSKVGIAVVGISWRGKTLADVILNVEGCELKGIVDISEERLAEAKQRYPEDIIFTTDYEKILEREDIDAVVITTPQYTHCELTLKAFSYGKHVFCEKPLAVSIEECNKMIEAAESSKKVFIVGQQMRYHFYLHKMYSLIKQGEIGRLVMMWLHEFREPFRIGHHSWVFDKNKSGGMLVEKSCHHFDLFNWFAESKPIKVYTSAGQDYFKEIGGVKSTINDNAWVIVDYENGVRASLGLCMFLGRPHVKQGAIGYHNREIGIIGTDGLIKNGGELEAGVIDVHYATNRNFTRIKTTAEGCYPNKFNQPGNVGIIMDFVECIKTGKKPFASAEIGRDALAVSLAAEKSAEEGRIVYINEIY